MPTKQRNRMARKRGRAHFLAHAEEDVGLLESVHRNTGVQQRWDLKNILSF
jgi:hypothetical protein